MRLLVTLFCLLILSSVAKGTTEGKVVIGFSQIGAESAWRTANTQSMIESAKAAGFELLLSNAQQNQLNQLNALKSFILQKVDVIVLAPVVKTGWREVLLRARRAGIPVVLIDRGIEKSEMNLVSVFIGSDFERQGEMAAECLFSQAKLTGKSLRIFELRGTDGSDAAVGRSIGFKRFLKKHVKQLQLADSKSGDFRESEGRAVISREITKNSRKNFDAVFAHNDDMALGAIAAFSADVNREKLLPIVSVDGGRAALTALKNRQLACVVECSPLLGPDVFKAVGKVLRHEPIESVLRVEPQLFDQSNVDQFLPSRTY